MLKNIFHIATLFLLVVLISFHLFADENNNTLQAQDSPKSIVTSGGKSYSLAFGHQFSVIENKLFFNSDMRTGDKIFISDMKGKKIFGYVHELDISRIRLPEIKPGIYVVSKMRNNNIVNKNQVVIGLSPK
jgi:hypothetical protein